jgi:hypothetical protein
MGPDLPDHKSLFHSICFNVSPKGFFRVVTANRHDQFDGCSGEEFIGAETSPGPHPERKASTAIYPQKFGNATNINWEVDRQLRLASDLINLPGSEAHFFG